MKGNTAGAERPRGLQALLHRMKQRKFRNSVVILLLVFLFLALIMFPYYWMVSSSLQGKSVFQWPPELWPKKITFEAYRTITEKKTIDIWFRNTAIVSLSSALFSLAVSVNAAYSLSRFRNRINSLFGVLILVTQMLPATLLVIPFYIIFRELGLQDKLPGLIVADTTFSLPLSIWMMKGFFDSIPMDLEEQAMVDGATRFAAFRKIALPLSLPGLVVVAVWLLLATSAGAWVRQAPGLGPRPGGGAPRLGGEGQPEWLRGTTMQGYGTTLTVGIGVPIPILSEEILRYTAVKDAEIVAPIVDYSQTYPQRKPDVLGEVSYAQLKSGKIKVQGKVVPTASLSSYSRAVEIASILKNWIQQGDFLLTEPVAPLPGVESGIVFKNLEERAIG